MYQRVLLTVDGSAMALAAAAHALRAVHPADGEIVLLHVVEAPAAMPGQSVTFASRSPAARVSPLIARAQEELQAGARAHVAAVAEWLTGRGAPRVRPIVVSGQAAPTILATAREERSEVLVMATHGRTGLMRQVAGSVADRVIRGLGELPLLLVRPAPDDVRAMRDLSTAAPEADGYRRVIVAIDGSPTATRAALAGARVAAPDAAITLLAIAARKGDPAIASAAEETRAAIEGEGHALAGVEVRHGDPAEIVIAAAAAGDADLVAMSTHGWSRISRLIVGSVADAVLRARPGLPLLLERPPASSVDAPR